ncbi:MAG: glycosyl hydrolase 115 family protein, partial [Proteobacteria bacterium]|nr:glycosyl hydrolase 115 family protein [Pseudomonadota bacterium]
VKIEVYSAGTPATKNTIVVGTVGRHALIDRLAADGKIALSGVAPGPRGGIWEKVTHDGRPLVVLAGSDYQGTQYAVYDYSRDVLGVDPLNYWTGIEPDPISDLDIGDFRERVIAPPKIPYLIYFENDVDELANLREPLLEYDWETYTELIDALVRLRYNGIELFDMLGRTEFFTRPAYLALRPDYETNLDLVERMIDYAHEKGMLVQIDMMMGRQFGRITTEESNCWSEHRDAWIGTWSDYLSHTPIGKADIFTLRPRNQLLDWPYVSACDEDRVTVFNEVYAAFGELLDALKPGAVKVCVCYDDGMDLYNEGFGPPEDFIVAWSDDGWGGFRVLPDDTRGYRFGTYMHAGFWLNHTVHDPYPEKIDEIMSMMVDRFGANEYLMVNGQTFRPFMINIEAFSRFALSPDEFDGDAFYRQWLGRYFHEDSLDGAVSALKSLHAAQFDNVGYVQNLWEIREAVAYLSDAPIDRPDRTPVPVGFDRVGPDIDATLRRLTLIAEARDAALDAMERAGPHTDFFHDHVLLPILLYEDLLRYEAGLHRMAKLKRAHETSADPHALAQTRGIFEETRSNFARLHERRMEGDRLARFAGWYDPAIRRPNNGFPTTKDLEAIEANLSHGWR